MRSPSFVSGTTVWAATLCSGVEISSFGDVRDPRAGDACPQRLPPRRTSPRRGAVRPAPASPSPCPKIRRAPRCPAAQPWDRRSTPPRAPQLRSGLKLSLDPARRFGPAGDMRRAVHFPRRLAAAIYRLDAFPSCLPWQYIVLMRSRRGLGRGKHRFVATYRLHAFRFS